MTTVALTPSDVSWLTGRTVKEEDIALAASLIDEQTGYTVDEHVDERGVSVMQVQAAWAMVAVRVNLMLSDVGSEAVTSETQGDYTYTEDAKIAATFRFGNVTDGRPSELLNRDRARWAHI
jgi:hypothetical protein